LDKAKGKKGCFVNIISQLGVENASPFAEMMRMSRKDFGL